MRNYILVCLPVSFLLRISFCFSQPGLSLVYPPDNSFVTDTTSVELQWDSLPGVTSFQLQLAIDPIFSSITHDTVIGNEMAILNGLSWLTTYHWRVRAVGPDTSQWTSSYQFFAFHPVQITGLKLLISADSNVFKDGSNNVDSILDWSGNGYTAAGPSAARRPVWDSLWINNLPGLHFIGGSGGQALDVAGFPSLSTGFSIFSVLSPDIALKGGGPFVSGGYGVAANVSGNNFNTVINQQQLKVTASSVIVDGSKTYLLTGKYDGSISSLFLNGITNEASNADPAWPSTTSRIAGGLTDWTFGGTIGDLIVYDRSLASNEQQMVESYLRDKYAPPVSLGPNILLDDRFCDTTLATNGFYENYLWSTGETSPTILVNTNGIYSVTVTDLFGRSSVDSVEVVFPAIQQPPGQSLLCLNDSITWNTGLPKSKFTYLWNDSSTDSLIIISQAGDYHVQITDLFGCDFYSDTLTIAIDSFSTILSLGNDTGFCSGNSIGIRVGFETADSSTYLWSDGSTSSTLAIASSGSYWLQVSDTVGCVAHDTIQVNVAGDAPVALFASDTVCLGDSTRFTDLSTVTPPATVATWQWVFGDGDSASVRNPVHLYTSPGLFTVNLMTISDSGCTGSASASVLVKELPQPFFADSLTCENSTLLFSDLSTPPPGDSILAWKWFFGNGDSAVAQNPAYTYTSPGAFLVTLQVTASNECTNAFSDSLQVIPRLDLPQSTDLIFPANYGVVFDSAVTFLWDNNPDAYSYIFELASDSAFSSTIDSISTDSSFSFAAGLQPGITYYWRVTAVNFCGDLSYSPIHQFEMIVPSTVPGLQLWLRADKGVVKDGAQAVSLWKDQTSFIKNAYQPTTGKQPLFIPAVDTINHQPAIQFDGNDDFLSMDSSITIGEIFVIANWGVNTTTFPDFSGLITEQDGASNNVLLIARGSTPNLFESGPFGDSIFINNIASKNFTPFIRHKIISGRSNTPLSLNDLFIASERGRSGRYWNGLIAEILVFDHTLSSSERNNVFTYLRAKYAPPVNLGPDVIEPYSYCPKNFSVDSIYASYNWSNGNSTHSVNIDKPGQVSLQTKDIFGFLSADTMQYIHQNLFNQISDTTICLGDTIYWNTGLDHNYNFLWSDNSSDSILLIPYEDNYWVTITDSLGCVLTLDTIFIKVDSFPATATLGPDTNLCSGNTISLISGAADATSYQWHDGSTTPTFTVDTAGQYWLNVTNQNGCTATDTLTVLSIIGKAPFTLFSASAACENDSMNFSDLSSVLLPDTLATWYWDFGDLAGDSTRNPAHLYQDTGKFAVTLNVSTGVGCTGSYSDTVIVYPLPIANFQSLVACENAATTFNSQSFGYRNDDPVAGWQWDFGDGGTASIKDPFHVFAVDSIFSVRLIAATAKGCRDTVTKSVVVKPSPQAAFEHTEVCDGQVIKFADISVIPFPWTATSRYWEFGDGKPGSSGTNPIYLYDSAGTYPVMLVVKANSGCVDTLVQDVEIHALPEAYLKSMDFCLDIPFQLQDSSYVANDSIVAWQWDLAGYPTSTDRQPAYTIGQTGTYNVTLQVTSSAGCQGTTQGTVTVHDPPVPDFTFSPDYGAPPLAVAFNNTSTGATTYFWNFGDGGTSSNVMPAYTYQNTGIYTIALMASDAYGCIDSTSKSIKVMTPSLDLAVISVKETVSNGFASIRVTLANFGTRDITGADLIARAGQGHTIRETWTGQLATGQVTDYIFVSSLEVPPGASFHYICVEAASPNGETDDQSSNNIQCATAASAVVLADPFPNPAGDHITFDFILPDEGEVSLDIYDADGKLLTSLYNNMAAKGLNRVPYDTRDLARGFYTCQLSYHGTVIRKHFVRR